MHEDLLKQIASNTKQNKKWNRADRVMTYVTSIVSIILSLIVFSQHEEINTLKAIAKADTSILANTSGVLYSLDTSIKTLNDINKEDQKIFIEAEQQNFQLKEIFKRANTPLEVIAHENYDRKKQALNKLEQIMQYAEKELVTSNIERDSLSAVKILSSVYNLFKSQDTSYAFLIDTRILDNWNICENYIGSALSGVRYEFGDNKEGPYSRRADVRKMRSDELGELLGGDLYWPFLVIRTQINQQLEIGKPIGAIKDPSESRAPVASPEIPQN